MALTLDYDTGLELEAPEACGTRTAPGREVSEQVPGMSEGFFNHGLVRVTVGMPSEEHDMHECNHGVCH